MRFVKFHLNGYEDRVAYFRVDRITVVFENIPSNATCIQLQNAVDGEDWQIRETLEEAMQRIEEAMKD